MKNLLFLLLTTLFLIEGCKPDDTEIVKSFSNRIKKVEILSTSENTSEYTLPYLEDSIKIIKIDLSQLEINPKNKKILEQEIDSLSEKIHISRLKYCLIGSTFTITHSKPDGHNGNAIHDAVSDSFYGGIFTSVKINGYDKCYILTNFNGNFDESFTNALRSAFFGNNNAKRKAASFKYIGNEQFEISNGWVIEVTDLKNCKSKLISTK